MALLAALLTFLIAGCVVFGLWLAVSGGAQQDVIQQRLEAVRQTERRGNASLEVQLLRDEMLSTVPAVNRMMMKWNWAASLRRYINQAGLTTKPANVVLMMGVFALTAYVFVGFLYHQFAFSVAAACMAAFVPFAVIAWKRSSRLGKFEERLPEALDLLGRALAEYGKVVDEEERRG